MNFPLSVNRTGYLQQAYRYLTSLPETSDHLDYLGLAQKALGRGSRGGRTASPVIKTDTILHNDEVGQFGELYPRTQIQNWIKTLSYSKNPFNDSRKALLEQHLKSDALPHYLTKLISAGFNIRDIYEPNILFVAGKTHQISYFPRLSKAAADFLYPPAEYLGCGLASSPRPFSRFE